MIHSVCTCTSYHLLLFCSCCLLFFLCSYSILPVVNGVAELWDVSILLRLFFCHHNPPLSPLLLPFPPPPHLPPCLLSPLPSPSARNLGNTHTQWSTKIEVRRRRRQRVRTALPLPSLHRTLTTKRYITMLPLYTAFHTDCLLVCYVCLTK